MFRTMHADREGRLLADVSEYVKKHNVIYRSPVYAPQDGLPLGNGVTGGMVYHTSRALCQRVCRTDSFDGAKKPGRFGAWAHEWEEKSAALASCGLVRILDGVPGFAWEYLEDYDMTLDLGEAGIEMRSLSPLSSCRARGYGSFDAGCLVWEVSFSSPEPLERSVRLERYGSRAFIHGYETLSRDPACRLDGVTARVTGGGMLVTQKLQGTAFTTAVRVDCPGARYAVLNSRETACLLPASKEISFRVLIATALSSDGGDTEAEALARLSAAAEEGSESLYQKHLDRWRAFWNRSFLSVEDEFAEFLWYFNRYQFGSAGYGSFPPSVFGSLWTAFGDARNWGHFYHWNDQMQFWPVDVWDQGELAESYFAFRRRMLPKAEEDCRALHGADGAWFSDIASAEGDQAAEPDTRRNMTCGAMIALQMYRHWRHYPDRDFLLNTAYPVMEAVASAYRSLLKAGADGKLHLRDATALEGYLHMDDTLTDWAMIRALYGALLDIAEEAGVGEEKQEGWRELLSLLYDPPTVNENGKTFFAYGRRPDGSAVRDAVYPESGMAVGSVGALFPVFPASLYGLGLGKDPWTVMAGNTAETFRTHLSSVGWDPAGIAFARLGWEKETREFIRDALRKYVVYPSGLTHYSPGELDSLYLPRAIPADAEDTPWGELHEKDRGERVTLHSGRFTHFYSEPMGVISAALNESLLQSHADGVRVFPAASEGLFRLHAEGDFMIVSEKRDGRVLYVSAESRRGGLFKLVSPFPGAECVRSEGQDIPFELLEQNGERTLLILTEPGRFYLVFSRTHHVDGSYPTRVPSEINREPRTFGNRVIGVPRDF